VARRQRQDVTPIGNATFVIQQPDSRSVQRLDA
jgi:hypothetical protein